MKLYADIHTPTSKDHKLIMPFDTNGLSTMASVFDQLKQGIEYIATMQASQSKVLYRITM